MSAWPFFAYYGGKWRAARRYPAPIFNRIIEPFAGAAGYALRYPNRDVVLIEKDARLAALWRYLITASPQQILALPLIQIDQTIDDLQIEPVEKDLVGWWLNKGAAMPCRRPSKWMRSGIRPNSFWGEKIRARIARDVTLIKHWTIIEGDYRSAPNDTCATWFIDPPYEQMGRHYRCGSNDIDFRNLGEWSQNRLGQIIVCEQEGAQWLPFRPHIILKANEGGNGKKRSAEVIWTGGWEYDL